MSEQSLFLSKMVIEQISITFHFAVTYCRHFATSRNSCLSTNKSRTTGTQSRSASDDSTYRSDHCQALKWLSYCYGLHQHIHTHNPTYSYISTRLCACVRACLRVRVCNSSCDFIRVRSFVSDLITYYFKIMHPVVLNKQTYNHRT